MPESSDEIRHQLASERALYIYTSALEHGDLDDLATILQEASHDPVLERMILETHEAYQHEDTPSREHTTLAGSGYTPFSKQMDKQPIAPGSFTQNDHVSELSPALSDLLNAQAHPANETEVDIDRISLASMSPSISSHATRHSLRRQISQAISTLAAVLAVVILLSGFFVLFASHSTGTGHSNDVRTWSIIPCANPNSASNALLSVAALSANDAWAVGFTSPTSVSQASQSLIEHWNGVQWSVVTSPKSTMVINVLNDVVALSTDDVWAVGLTSSPSVSQVAQPLIEHWNGRQWSIASRPEGAQQSQVQSDTLSRLLVLSTNDVWGVGTSIDHSGHSTTLIEHWTGTTWNTVPSPNPGSMKNELRGAVAVSANDIWAVGSFANGNTNARGQTLIEHWDGRQWSVVPSPEGGSINTVLNAMTAVSANNVWAIGVSSNSSSTSMGQALIEHWDGMRWSIVKSPNAGAEENFDSLTTIAANDIWAVGISSHGSEGDEIQGLTLHWDGGQWRIISSPNRGSSTLLSSIGKIPGSSSIWAVGYYSNPNTNTTSALTLRYQ